MLRYLILLAYLARGKKFGKKWLEKKDKMDDEADDRGVFYHYDNNHDDDYFDLKPVSYGYG